MFECILLVNKCFAIFFYVVVVVWPNKTACLAYAMARLLAFFLILNILLFLSFFLVKRTSFMSLRVWMHASWLNRLFSTKILKYSVWNFKSMKSVVNFKFALLPRLKLSGKDVSFLFCLLLLLIWLKLL